jgi:hypothetical protein
VNGEDRAAEGVQYQSFHNGVRIENERAVEFVPLPDPENTIIIQ